MQEQPDKTNPSKQKQSATSIGVNFEIRMKKMLNVVECFRDAE